MGFGDGFWRGSVCLVKFLVTVNDSKNQLDSNFEETKHVMQAAPLAVINGIIYVTPINGLTN